MQSDDLGLAKRARAAASIANGQFLNELAAAIERLVAERDEAREAKSYLAATRNEQLRELTNANTELFWAGVQDVRRLTRMKAALKPFARLALKIPADRPDSDLDEVPTSWLRRARQALKDAP